MKRLGFLMILLSTPSIAFASFFTPAKEDVSIRVINFLTGGELSKNSSLGLDPEQRVSFLFQNIFSMFNWSMAVFGLWFLAAFCTIAVVRSANSGMWASNQKDDLKSALARVLLGAILALPVTGFNVDPDDADRLANKFSVAQHAALILVVNGVGLADRLWEATVDRLYVEHDEVDAPVITARMQTPVLVANTLYPVLRSQMCLEKANRQMDLAGSSNPRFVVGQADLPINRPVSDVLNQPHLVTFGPEPTRDGTLRRDVYSKWECGAIGLVNEGNGDIVYRSDALLELADFIRPVAVQWANDNFSALEFDPDSQQPLTDEEVYQILDDGLNNYISVVEIENQVIQGAQPPVVKSINDQREKLKDLGWMLSGFFYYDMAQRETQVPTPTVVEADRRNYRTTAEEDNFVRASSLNAPNYWIEGVANSDLFVNADLLESWFSDNVEEPDEPSNSENTRNTLVDWSDGSLFGETDDDQALNTKVLQLFKQFKNDKEIPKEFRGSGSGGIDNNKQILNILSNGTSFSFVQNPFLQLKEAGEALMKTASIKIKSLTSYIITAAAGSGAASGVSGVMGAFTGAAKGVGGQVAFGVGSTLFATGAAASSSVVAIKVATDLAYATLLYGLGATLGMYIPLIAATIFLFGVLGWIIAVVESMVAAPLVVLGLLFPEGGNQLLGRAEPAFMILLNLTLRPALMVCGLLAGLLVFWVGYMLTGIGFAILLGTDAFGLTNENGGGAGLLIMFAFTALVVTLCNKSFSLIFHIPNRCLSWIGDNSQYAPPPDQELNQVQGKVDQGGQGSVGAEEKSMQATAQAAQQGATTVGSSAGSATQNAVFSRQGRNKDEIDIKEEDK